MIQNDENRPFLPETKFVPLHEVNGSYPNRILKMLKEARHADDENKDVHQVQLCREYTVKTCALLHKTLATQSLNAIRAV